MTGTITVGSHVYYRASGIRCKGVVVEIAQIGKHRGKWRIRSLETHAIVHRTTRALELRHDGT